MPDINQIKNVHPIYSLKRDIWVQIAKSYSGGIVYKNAEPSYLHAFSSREPDSSFRERKKRAVFFNNTQPLADTLTGFLFSSEVIRNDFKYDYLIEKADKRSGLTRFMQKVAVNSLLYTCGVLVDSPAFNPEMFPTQADRASAGLNPYAVLYMPWQIRNFYFDEFGALKALLLDNSTFKNDDFLEKPKINISFRLWTPEYFQDFTSEMNAIPQDFTGLNYSQIAYGVNRPTAKFIEGEKHPHPCGKIPFHFVNWFDKGDDHFADTIFEDISLFDQAVYNYMSLMDEMLSGGVFKFLFYPGKAPESISSAGFANCAVIEYDPASSHEPKFDGPALGDVKPFIEAIEFYLRGIKRTLGLDTDQDKSYSQSGEAKKFDFTKVKALLNAGAAAMEETEIKIHEFAGLWEGATEIPEPYIEYRRDFLGDEEEKELAAMFEIVNLPFRKMKEQAARRIADISFSETIEQEELEEIYEDIKGGAEDSPPKTDINALVNLERIAKAGSNPPNNTNIGATDEQEI